MNTEPKTGTGESKALELFRRTHNSLVSSAMLVNSGVGFRYGDVIARLRKRGHEINTIRPEDGPAPHMKSTFWYELVHDASCVCESEGPLFCSVHAPSYIDHVYEQEKGRRTYDER